MGPQRRRLGNTDITENTRLHPSVCRKLFTCLQSVLCFFPSGTLGIKAAAPLTGLYGVLPGGSAPSLTSISLETCVSHSLIAWMSFLQFWEEIISLYSLKWKTPGKKKTITIQTLILGHLTSSKPSFIFDFTVIAEKRKFGNLIVADD